LPALAFGSHYSVFKERPGTHLSCRCWCRVARRTVPDELLRRRVSFGCRRARGGRSDGCVTLADSRRTVNAFGRAEIRRALAPDRPREPIVAGHPPHPADARPNDPVPSSTAARRHRTVACGEPPGPPHATRCSKPNWLSAPALSPTRPPGGRAPPADLLDLPHVRHVTPCDDGMMDQVCCTVVTGR